MLRVVLEVALGSAAAAEEEEALVSPPASPLVEETLSEPSLSELPASSAKVTRFLPAFWSLLSLCRARMDTTGRSGGTGRGRGSLTESTSASGRAGGVGRLAHLSTITMILLSFRMVRLLIGSFFSTASICSNTKDTECR